MIRSKILILFVFISCIFQNCFAEVWDTGYRKIHVVDTARYEIIYTHIQNDRVKNKTEIKDEMLSIGNNHLVYGGYGNFQLDSLYLTFTKKPPFEEGRRLYKEYEPITDALIVDTQRGIINYFGHIFMNYYKYSEPIPEFDWTITHETENIMGYECVKATADWRGRKWFAWFSDIPVNGGPWKFQGLPGLILKVEDSEGDHSIYAIGFKNDIFPIGCTDRAYMPTSREKYIEAKKDYSENAGRIMAESGMVELTDDTKKEFAGRRLFYAPMELE